MRVRGGSEGGGGGRDGFDEPFGKLFCNDDRSIGVFILMGKARGSRNSRFRLDFEWNEMSLTERCLRLC